MAEDKLTTIVFQDEEGNDVTFDVVAETRFQENNYVLVTEPDDDVAVLLKEVRDENDDIVYETIEDDKEFEAVGELFSAILEDIELN